MGFQQSGLPASLLASSRRCVAPPRGLPPLPSAVVSHPRLPALVGSLPSTSTSTSTSTYPLSTGPAWRAWRQAGPRGRSPGRPAAAAAAAAARSPTAAFRAGGPPAVVVVESPTKAKKIQGFLGSNYLVVASYGHVRDLPGKEGSVDPDRDFELRWALMPSAGPRLEALAQAATGSPLLVLATDPDREGEAISWHIQEELRRRGVLGQVGAVQRITFTEITRTAVTQAMAAGRQVSQPLVDAYLARRALDYLVGFHLSPVLWRKLPGARSAGRVQSVALRLVCDREAAVEAFTAMPYWSVTAQLQPPGGAQAPPVVARLVGADGRRLGPTDIDSEARAQELAARIQSAPLVVSRVAVRRQQRHPPPPFTTASLQAEASRRLGMGASRTMRLAQQLYEGAGTGDGLITYMRTDGVSMSAEAVDELRKANGAMYGKAAVPPEPRQYKVRAKNAQEAHEAIRPTHPARLVPGSPDLAALDLDPDQRALYEMIWRRAVASQMTSASYEVVTVELSGDGGALTLRAGGRALLDSGFLKAYDDVSVEGDEEEAPAEAQGRDSDAEEGGAGGSGAAPAPADNVGAAAAQLLKLQSGAALAVRSVAPLRHTTRPPPRFTEASLVRALEERGIGRPSTYAPIMSLLQDRGYMAREGRSLLPTSLGRVLSAFLARYFERVVDEGFTRDMEGRLDDVAGGRAAWKGVLRDFWGPFAASVAAMGAVRTTAVFDYLDSALEGFLFPGANRQQQLLAAGGAGSGPQTIDVTATAVERGGPQQQGAGVEPARVCPKCGRGRLVLKPSRFGGFIGCTMFGAEGVECGYARPLLPVMPGGSDASLGSESDSEAASTSAAATERLLGHHPDTGEPIYVRLGPYGLYVQQGDTPPKKPKAKAKKPKAKAGKAKKGSKAAVEAAEAAALASAADAAAAEEAAPAKPRRASVPKERGANPTVAGVTLAAALALLALPRTVGLHPGDGQPVVANNGPFGPYVAHAGLSASLGRKATTQDVDLETAVLILEAKRARAAAREAKGLPPLRGRARASGGSKKSAKAPANSGYNLFQSTRWAEMKAAAPAPAWREAQAAISTEWRSLDPDQQSAWAQRAEAEAAIAAMQAPAAAEQAQQGAEAEGQEAVAEADVKPKRGSGAKAAATAKPKAKAKATAKAKAKAAGKSTSSAKARSTFRSSGATATAAAAPPANAYLAFCRVRRPGIRAENPGGTLGDVSRLLAAEWAALGEAEKAQYRAQVQA
ncbi:hypothetical protein HYH03_000886 [Edaphochlamys debaryana]|uniref:DNA topoisomerase n=1 Tax=Edaphochlamys debaryana TaxID=47281 RepID=A0A835YG13_9CHLO|nr:hypothetical protein HYH03_000886 [Edaphochlamys debaryana]|eukprot:KAG2501067.1 hypothetical protein HYH03_000886 [Edaphochlamys debaryana]